MLKIIPSRDESTVALEIEGDAKEEDTDKLNQYVQANFGENESFNMLAIFHDLDSATFKGLVKGMKFDTKRWDQFNKFAIVSGKKSIETFTKMGDYLPGVTAKHFKKDEQDQAWLWIKQAS
ncbi:STAS/SEC14 domain-containing protein [Pseudalkalibacillus sp. A8]|uniref:STAS/SEC14 domain-containing protein n=1 Tax=Pseudalkalibacillus sp. A8 TaxID=3382641 RepID=UPI0038B5D865